MLLQRLGLSAYTKYNNCLYFYERYGLGICKYDNENEMVTVIKDGGGHFFYKYSDVICCDEKLIFAPYQEENILIYDLVNSFVEQIPIGEKGYAIKIIKAGDKFYLIRQKDNYIEFDLDTKIIKTIFFEEKVKCASHSDVCVVDDRVFVPTSQKGSILEINLIKCKTALHSLNIDTAFTTIAYANMCFWLSGDNEQIIVWNPRENNIEKISMIDDISIRNKIGWRGVYSSSVLIDNDLFFAPLAADSILKINVNTKAQSVVMRVPESNISWCICKWDQDEVYISLENAEGLTEMDFVIGVDGKICRKDVIVIADENCSNIIRETQWDSLKYYIENI
ncbi:MAG: hypothetical protein IJ716_09645 [Lachnospiraceae bacterium]|nr:hypothetical protein [Lachnospiraceae bacterium]